MEWLKDRLTERSSIAGFVTFIVGLLVQFVPALKDIFTPELQNAITLVLVTVGGVLFGATTKVSPNP